MKKTTRPLNPEVAHRRLLLVSRDRQLVNGLYQDLVEIAKVSHSTYELTRLTVIAIREFLKTAPSAKALLVFKLIPAFLGAITDDAQIVKEAKTMVVGSLFWSCWRTGPPFYLC